MKACCENDGPWSSFYRVGRLGPTRLNWRCSLTNNILWADVKGFQSSHRQTMKLSPHAIDVDEG